MQFKELGRTGISVSQICLGTMTWGQQNTEAEAHEQIEYALDAGINFMDTAELYAIPPRAETQGRTEEYIGRWFEKTGKRDQWVLASKIAGPGNSWIRGGRKIDANEIVSALEMNLARLKTDYIDLYQLHWPNRRHYNFDKSWGFDPYGQDRCAIEANMLEVLEALDAQVKAGKIRAIGLSNETSWGTLNFVRLAEKNGLARVASVQNEYNLIRRQHDLDMAEVSFFEDVGLLAYSPLGAGVLSGKYLDGQTHKGSRGDIGSMWRQHQYSEPAIRAYCELAARHDLDPNQMAIAFCLTRPFMTAAIIGATSMEQLKTDIAAKDVTLSDEVLTEIDAIHRRYPRPI
jgi:aryl-alcohol dehydrogenase-like predicted oxidoreductase